MARDSTYNIHLEAV